MLLIGIALGLRRSEIVGLDVHWKAFVLGVAMTPAVIRDGKIKNQLLSCLIAFSVQL